MELNAIGCDPAQSAQHSASNGIELPVQSKLVIQFRSASISFTSVRVKCWSSMSDWITLFWNWIGIRCRYWFYLLKFCLKKKAALHASSLLHNRLFAKVFNCPTRYFESTPIGRILNLFSRDLDESKALIWFQSVMYWFDLIWLDNAADGRLVGNMEQLLQNMLTISITILFVVLVYPWFLTALLVMGGIFFFVDRMFRRAVRDLKRLENVSRSPIFSHVAATVNGLNTIHAFAKERQFISK